MAHGTTNAAMVTIGLDLGDRQTAGCVVDAGGQILERFQARTTPTRLLAAVTRWPGARVVLEVGGQSPWVSRRLQAAGYGVVVANARRVRLIAEGDAKSDRLDAELLARLGRVDPALLAPIQHRSERTQRDLGVVKTRAALVRMRTLGINHGRGVAKALGHRLPACAAEAFPARVRAQAVGATLPGITELLAVLEQLTASIRALDRQLATLATTRYPVTELLRQVPGVGPPDGADLRAHAGGPDALPPQPHRGRLSRPAAEAPGLRRSAAGAVDHEGGGCAPAPPSGDRGAVHPGAIRARHRFAPMGAGAGRPGRQSREETGGRGGGAEAGRAAASAVVDGRGVRTGGLSRAGGIAGPTRPAADDGRRSGETVFG